MKLYTIGHSNLSLEEFIDILHRYDIQVIVDVRSHPYSRYLPHFSKKLLEQELIKHHIKYIFLGEQLGARPNNPDCYVNGKVVYAKIAATLSFTQGIEQLLKLANSAKTAIMCAEKDPINCHRSILICQHLKNNPELEIIHILRDGNSETHQSLERRLLKCLQLNLFSYHEDLIKQAYQNQGEKIAYKKK